LKRLIRYILLVNLITINFGCIPEKGYTFYKSVSNEGLGLNPLIFKVPEGIVNSSKKNIFLRLRNNNEYPYSNIFLLASLRSGEDKIYDDTLEYAMASADGTWLGSGFNEIKESKLWWKGGIILPNEKPLIIQLEKLL
jgi:gliding motility-associated lipoprotein GldH